MFKNSKINLQALAAGLLIFVSGVFVFIVMTSASKSTQIMTASTNLNPYTMVKDGSGLVATSVPAKSVTPDDLTKVDYDTSYALNGVVPLVPMFSGQRIDRKAIALTPLASFATVLPDELVVAVNATIAGAVSGGIKAGDVANVSLAAGSSSGADTESDFAKVLCVGTSLSDCKGVTPFATKFSSTKVNDSSSTSSPVKVLLAVNKFDAQKFAGQAVVFSLNTFCGFSADGYFTSLRSEKPLACHAPDTRAAAHQPKVLQQPAAAAPAPGTTITPSATATNTTPVTTTTASTTPGAITTTANQPSSAVAPSLTPTVPGKRGK